MGAGSPRDPLLGSNENIAIWRSGNKLSPLGHNFALLSVEQRRRADKEDFCHTVVSSHSRQFLLSRTSSRPCEADCCPSQSCCLPPLRRCFLSHSLQQLRDFQSSLLCWMVCEQSIIEGKQRCHLFSWFFLLLELCSDHAGREWNCRLFFQNCLPTSKVYIQHTQQNMLLCYSFMKTIFLQIPPSSKPFWINLLNKCFNLNYSCEIKAYCHSSRSSSLQLK